MRSSLERLSFLARFLLRLACSFGGSGFTGGMCKSSRRACAFSSFWALELPVLAFAVVFLVIAMVQE